MTVYRIRGGRPLKGAVSISGAKNAALPVLAAVLASDGPCVVEGVPMLRDVNVMLGILSEMGVELEQESGENSTWKLDAAGLNTTNIPEQLMQQMRSSIFLMGPLLAAWGRVRAVYPGGCDIGPRPINIHLTGLKALGAEIEEKGGFIYAEAPGGLKGCDFTLDYPSVGATENLLMAAVKAEGETVLRNTAREPEIVDLSRFLRNMGARVEGAGSDTIRIEGQQRLRPAQHRVMPDRIEAGTYLIAAAATAGTVRVKRVEPVHLRAVLAKLEEAGVSIEQDSSDLMVKAPERMQSISLRTLPYPGFPTDLQNPMMAGLCTAEGTSIITETVFEKRFKVAEEFRRMGASIQIEGRTAIVQGVERLTGARVQSQDDLRGGAALVLAGLGADGETIVGGAQHVQRGYEQLVMKLRSLGADIEEVRDGSD